MNIAKLKQMYLRGCTITQMMAVTKKAYQDTSRITNIKLNITAKDIKTMELNLLALHKEYNKLRSYRSNKERRLEATSQILCRRIALAEKRLK